VATERNETDLLGYALRSWAEQVEHYCRRLRNGDAEVSAVDARRIHERRWLSRSLREDGSGTLTVDLPKEQLDLVLAALDAVAKSLPEDPTRSIFATGADALVRMAEAVLSAEGPVCRSDLPVANGRVPVEVVVHIDASALSGAGGTADLPLPTVKRLCCDGAVVALIEDTEGRPLDVGRRQRVVSTSLKRAVFARDAGCVFPGCHHTRFIDTHHVHHWADGGDTTLDNLICLCTSHHRLVHEGGFAIQRNADGTYYFTRPDGRPLDRAYVPRGDRVEEERPVYGVECHSAEWRSVGRSAAFNPAQASSRETARALH
jgi:hypothetical protein